MLKYLWMVIQDLFLTVTFVTLIHSLIARRYGRKGTVLHWAGIGLGVVSSITLAIVKNTTNKIVSSRWNHKIYIVIILLTLLFLIASFLCARKKDQAFGGRDLFLCIIGSGLSAIWIFYTLPGAAAYPFIFNTMGNGYLSWYYFSRLLGWLMAFLVLMIYACLLGSCALHIKNEKLPFIVLLASITVNAFYCFGRFFVPWVNRAKWLKWPVRYTRESYGWAGALVTMTQKYSMLFIWFVALLTVILLVVYFMENTKITEPYDNPAQLRKLKARNRRHRRGSVALFVFLGISAFSMSVVKAYDTREVVLSEPETYEVDGDRILISMEDVSDGHLHRYEYTTENDVNVRWIVVKKPGSASFGVGLDACEVCGNAGYYERNGQVVCKRCDVVMNINTIGFQGGCNPIPLSYEADGGNLVFNLEDLMAGEKEFK